MRNKVESLLEWVLIILFIRGGVVTLLFADPLVVPGILQYLTGAAAVYVYGALILLTGLLLLYAKLRHRKKLHKHTLMAMFLICIYIFILAVSLVGWTNMMFLTIGVALASGYLWMRWTIRTEYINPKQFAEDVHKLR
jgi:phosphatidylserine synthase